MNCLSTLCLDVDVVKWERLRTAVSEMILRGAPGWMRHYLTKFMDCMSIH